MTYNIIRLTCRYMFSVGNECLVLHDKPVNIYNEKTGKSVPTQLMQQYGTNLDKDQKTIQNTRQKKIRTMLHPSLSRQCRTNDCNIHYHHLVHPVYSDAPFASAVSRRKQ